MGLIFGCIVLVFLTIEATEPKPTKTSKRPLSPREEQATFHLPKGFQIDLIAAEPDVVDPVAMTFDDDGRIFVAEMRGYPNGSLATSKITSRRIKVLEDNPPVYIHFEDEIFLRNH